MKLRGVLFPLVISFSMVLIASCDEGNQGGVSVSKKVTEPAVQPTAVIQNVWPPVADGVVPVEDKLARNFVVVFDGSGSMNDRACGNSERISKLEVAKKAVTHFIQGIPSEDNVGLVAFYDGQLSTLVPLGRGNRDALRASLNGIFAGGGTPLGEAIRLAFKEIEKQAQKQLGYGEYTIIPVTDGAADSSSFLMSEVSKVLVASPVVIHSIGFCIGTKHTLNQPGRTVYREASDVESLARGLEEVLAESPSFVATDFQKE